MEAAFQVLESEGILQTRPKQRALICEQPRLPCNDTIRKVGWLDGRPRGQLSSVDLRSIYKLQISLLEAGHQFELRLVAPARRKFTPAFLQRHLDQQRASHWVLANQPESVLAWFAGTGAKACILGSRPPSAQSLPAIDLCRPAAVRHATGLLLARGHRRIAFLTGESPSYEDAMVESAFLNAAIPTGVERALILKRHDGSGMGLRVILERLFCDKDARPDALIVAGGAEALTAYTFLTAHLRLRLPEDVSFISLDEEIAFAHFAPQPAHYTRTANALARSIFQLLQRLDQRRPEGKLEIPPDFVAGETVRVGG